MLRAVNRELKTFPPAAARSAEATLCRQLAREFDAGDQAASGRLLAALRQLRKLAAAEVAAAERAAGAGGAASGTSTGPAVGGEQPRAEVRERDEVDDLERTRATRLAEAAGVVSTLGADQRRRRGSAVG